MQEKCGDQTGKPAAEYGKVHLYLYSGDYFFDISDRPSITITFGDSSQTFVVSQENMKIRYTVDIPFGESTIDISYSGKRVDAPQDSRTLYFVMVEPQLERIK